MQLKDVRTTLVHIQIKNANGGPTQLDIKQKTINNYLSIFENKRTIVK